jgi:poly-gamma-glutamate synthesis protein (capsule biosynthesis protein)
VVALLPVALTLLLSAAPRVELVFGGDVIPHDPVKFAAKAHARHARTEEAPAQGINHDGWSHVFGPLAQTFRRADFAIVNLETPVTTNPKAVTAEMLFNAPPQLLQGLAGAGVTVAAFANNHCLDQHREGIVETRRHLAAQGLASVGADVDSAAAWAPLVLEKHGLRIALVAFTRQLNAFHNLPDAKAPHVPIVHYRAEPDVGGIDEAAFVEQIRALAPTVDAVLVYPHWGDEYVRFPRKEDRALALALLEAGALAVIGSHPHVLQPLELHPATGGVVAFSLGNLVSNQDWGEPESPKREGALLRLVLEKPEGAARARLVSAQPLPVWTDNRMGAGAARNVQPVVLDEELAALDERLSALASRTDRVSRAEEKALSRRRGQLAARRARILDFTGTGY